MIPSAAALYEEMIEEGADPEGQYCAVERIGEGDEDEYGRYRIHHQGTLMECIDAILQEADKREECELTIVDSAAFVGAMKTEGMMS